MPSTRQRVPEVASPPQTPPFTRLDIGIGYRIPMGEVVVPRPRAHPRISLARAHRSLRASPLCAVRPDRAAARGSIFARVREGSGGFGFGFGNPKSHQCSYLRFSLGFGVRGSAPPCGWVAESPPTGNIPESPPFQIQSWRDAHGLPPQEKGQPPERSPLMHERPD